MAAFLRQVIYVSLLLLKSQPYLPCLAGAQRQFTVTDKYTKKKVFDNWGKPCIWLNNQNPLFIPNLPDWQREYLEANCIFVNLDHRLYSPALVVPPIFNPPPAPVTP